MDRAKDTHFVKDKQSVRRADQSVERNDQSVSDKQSAYRGGQSTKSVDQSKNGGVRDEKYLQKQSRAGKGSYSIVYKATMPNGESCAVKRNFKCDKYNFIGSLRELDINHRFYHPNIIPIEQISDGNPFDGNMSPVTKLGVLDDDIHFIYPLATGNLSELINNSEECLSGSRIKKLMIQILLGIEYIHLSGFIHRDIKPENILIFPNDRLMIGDFGLAKPYHRYDYHTPGVMTAWYRAPEVLLQVGDYTQQADMWSVGCIFHQMFSGHLISKEMSKNSAKDEDVFLIQAIINTLPYKVDRNLVKVMLGPEYFPRLKYPEKVQSPDEFTYKEKWPQLPFEKPGAGTYAGYKRVLFHLLEFDPEKRKSATVVLNDPFFDDLRYEIDETRRKYIPNLELLKEQIHMCQIRTWAMDTVVSIYNNHRKFKWYSYDHKHQLPSSHKRLFQAINIFDRVLASIPRPNWSLEKTQLYFISCLYLAIKYYSVLNQAISFSDIADEKYTTRSNMEAVNNFEKKVVREILIFRVYQKTPFDVLLETHDPTPEETDTMLLMILCGHQDSMNAEESFEYWRNNYAYYLSNLSQAKINSNTRNRR